MEEYHKIQSVFKRDEKTHKFIEGNFSLPEFEYLKNNLWIFTEKIDGTNIRIFWDNVTQKMRIGGKTDNTSIPVFLLDKLNSMFTKEKFLSLYPDISMCLYGEGYGARIGEASGNYISSSTATANSTSTSAALAASVNFVLFDIKIDRYWLSWESVKDIASKVDIIVVPVVGTGKLSDALEICKLGFDSQMPNTNCQAEGMVLRPAIELQTKNGNRIITKIKFKDFER